MTTTTQWERRWRRWKRKEGSGGRGGEQQGGGSIICGGCGPVTLIFLLVFCPPWNMGSLFQSDVRG